MAKNSSKPVADTTKVSPFPGHTTKYDYVLGWIKESVEARQSQNVFVERAVSAYQGKPSSNRYKGTIRQYVESVRKHDTQAAEKINEACSDVPDKGSMVVHNAIEALVSMAMGGVGQYAFGPNDSDASTDAKLMDRLSSATKDFYNRNKVDSLLPQLLRNAALAGAGYWHLNQRNGNKTLTLLDSDQMLTDPKRFKTTHPRFIGYTQRESFNTVKDRVRKTKGGGYVLKTLNEAEVYVSKIKEEISSTVLGSNSQQSATHDELSRELDIFYKPLITALQTSNKNKEVNDPSKMYEGDEIEVAYMYDKMNDMYFEIINRRYIVIAKKNPLSRDIKCTYYDTDGNKKTKTKTVKLDDPFIELPYLKLPWSMYPVTPLFYVLDDFDDLCAMESVHFHNLSIMAPLTFVGQSSDTEKVARVASVAGEVVEGLPQTFGVLNKAHDMTPIVTAIQRNEEKIKRTMKAVDPFELQGMIGDRATAKEVVSASGQVSQGINPFLANIETAMATLGDKFIKLELIMNDDETYTFSHNGKYAELTREQMASGYDIAAKMVTSIKLEQEANSRKALELTGYLSTSEAVDKREFLGTMVPIILGGLVSREQAQKMVLPEYRPMPDEVIAAIKKQAEKDARKDDADKLNLNDYTPEELDKMAMEFAMAQGQGAPADAGAQVPPVPMDPALMQGATVVDPNMGAAPAPAMAPAGVPAQQVMPAQSPEQAGMVSNDPTGAGYVG